jgi:hypothetical protein
MVWLSRWPLGGALLAPLSLPAVKVEGRGSKGCMLEVEAGGEQLVARTV